MNRNAALGAGLVLGMALMLAGCGHTTQQDDDNGANAFPTNYKADILAGMHAYLNDPTGIRDAAIAQPALKQVGPHSRYVVCLKFNPKKNASAYAGVREVTAVFLAGRFEDFVDAPKGFCDGVTYTPFPELQKLPP